jgi:hypothetical protein
MAAPKCFISYSWDTPQHEVWVLELAKKLRGNGVEALLDKFELKLGYDLAQFMERSVRESDFVLLVCTPKFAEKADGGHGGVGYEKQIVTGEIFNGARPDKFVPVLRAGDAKAALPSYLKSKLFVDFRDDARFAASMEQLLRHVFGEPAFAAPPLGQRPKFEAHMAPSPAIARGVETLFSESFDDSFEDDPLTEPLYAQRRYGNLWLIGRDAPWLGRVQNGRYELLNDGDSGAIKYSFISATRADATPIDMSTAWTTATVNVFGSQPDPISGAGLLVRFDEATRHYGAFLVAHLGAGGHKSPSLLWAVRDAAGFRIEQRAVAPWLKREEEVSLSVETRAGELHLAADGREAFAVAADFLPGRSTGLIAIGRGKFTFDDFRVVSGL